MKIVIRQETPHLVYEVEEYAGSKDFNDIISWCHRTDLPEDLTLAVEGTMFRFRNRPERICWALGFDKAFDLLFDEPEVALWTDSDETYVNLGNSDRKEGLDQFAIDLVRELHLVNWVERLDDFKVYTSKSNLFLMKRSAWNELSMRQKQMLAARCHGFCEGLAAAV